MQSSDYQGVGQHQAEDSLALHFFDNDGPITINLPKTGLDSMCGRRLIGPQIELILDRHIRELGPLIDSSLRRQGGYTLAFWESGASYRRLDITTADISASGIALSTDILAMSASAGFADPDGTIRNP